jgi:hypothetical protein
MLTTPQEWAILTDAQRYTLLTETQADRDNLRAYLRAFVQGDETLDAAGRAAARERLELEAAV